MNANKSGSRIFVIIRGLIVKMFFISALQALNASRKTHTQTQKKNIAEWKICSVKLERD